MTSPSTPQGRPTKDEIKKGNFLRSIYRFPLRLFKNIYFLSTAREQDVKNLISLAKVMGEEEVRKQADIIIENIIEKDDIMQSLQHQFTIQSENAKVSFTKEIKNMENDFRTVVENARISFTEETENMENDFRTVVENTKVNFTEETKNMENHFQTVVENAKVNFTEKTENMENHFQKIYKKSKKKYDEKYMKMKNRITITILVIIAFFSVGTIVSNPLISDILSLDVLKDDIQELKNDVEALEQAQN